MYFAISEVSLTACTTMYALVLIWTSTLWTVCYYSKN